MPFTIEEFRDLLRLLEQHPEWRAELRRWVLSEELLTLPQAMRELVEAQRRTEEGIGRLAQAHETLAHQVQSLAQAHETLARQVSDLAHAYEALARRVDQLAEQVERLVEVQTRMATDLERLKGSDLERRYRERAHVYFRHLVRRAHVLPGEELAAFLDDAVTRGDLSDEEADQILQADLVIRGWRRDTRQEVYLVVEVSWGVGMEDVERAVERATLLTRLGVSSVPVVAGTWVTPDAKVVARAKKVWQITDSRVVPPETD